MTVNLFDANFYRAANADLASFNDAQALSHFQNFGLNEGRRFNALVDLGVYRASNSDLGSLNNQQLYEHLSNYGVAEGRKYSSFFDLGFYRANNGDLASFNNEQLFQHADSFGINEGRRFSPFVDLNFYQSFNSDLGGLNNEQLFNHLQIYGINEGRHFSPFVDLNLYRAANADLAAAGFNNNQLFEHLTNSGIAEGRRFSVSFDSSYYSNVDVNSDLAAAGLNSFQLFDHFQNFGLAEGRASSQSFNVTYYLGNNADLTGAGFNNVAALRHFEGVGFREGRVAAALTSLENTRNDNTLGTAPNLDVLSYNRTFSNQSVGTSDTNDFYRFLVADRSNLNISLSDVTSNAVVELIQDSNNNGEVDDGEVLFRRAAASGSNTAFQTGTLAGGTYFVRVAPDSGTSNTTYSVSMSANLVPPAIPRVPGTSPDNPFNIGTLSNGISSYRDVVSSAARDDYYQFTIANPTEFILSLTGLSGDADVQIFQGNASAQASPLYGSYNRGNASESIRTFLEAGIYSIQVFSNDGSTNNYNLRLSANSSTPIETNNTLGTAFSFGNLTGNSLTLRQVVGITDPEDFYSFSLNSTSTVKYNTFCFQFRDEVVSRPRQSRTQ